MRAAAAVAMLMLLVGCTAGDLGADGRSAAEASAPANTQVPCDQAISRAAPDDDAALVADALVLIFDSDSVLQATPIDAPDQDALFDGDGLWAKQGITVSGGRQIEVSVPSTAEDELYIGWGSPPEPATSVTIECGEESEWFTFAGGYWVAEAGCHTIEVGIDGNDMHEVDILIGADC